MRKERTVRIDQRWLQVPMQERDNWYPLRANDNAQRLSLVPVGLSIGYDLHVRRHYTKMSCIVSLSLGSVRPPAPLCSRSVY